jgi:small-conductance mechanosensitive channel
MPAPLANRFAHFTVDTHLDDWVHWAYGAGIDERLIGFLRFKPELLFDFDPAKGLAGEMAFPSPRSWEFAHRALQKFGERPELLPQALAAFERGLVALVWVFVVLHVTGLGGQLAAFADGVNLPVGKERVSLLTVVSAGFWVLATLLGALWIGSLLERRLLAVEAGDMAVRVVLARVMRALLLLVAVMVGLSLVGLDLTALSVFGGALGVGIGLGLQRVASSYVSGFVVLLERRVRIGDFVTVDKYHGQVSEIRTRFTVIRSIEGWSLIVPNEMLMTNPVQNFSQQPSARLRCRVGVAYGTDLEALLPRLEAVVAAHPRVVTEPPPVGMLAAFGADGLEVEVACSISQGEIGRSQVQSELNRAILAALRADDIEIPFPQREVRVLGGAPTGYTGKLP